MTTKKIHINFLQTNNNELPTIKNVETNKQSQQNSKNINPKVSAFNDNSSVSKKGDWNSYYEKQLVEIKSLYPNATHNELTSLISKKWKKAKKNIKFFDQLAQQIKKEDINSQIHNFDDVQIQQTNQETDQIIEKLRSGILKLVFCNQVFELKGQIILDAINQNRFIIYLNKQKENMNTKQEDQDKQQQENDNDNFQIVNNIKNYL